MPRLAQLATTIFLALTLAGCGDEAPSAPPIGPGDPVMETPAQAMARFEQAYESQVLTAYAAMLTADFSYRFSANADPNLVVQYGTSWGRARDSSSTSHLFDGFTNQYGEYVPSANTITLSLAGMRVEADPEHADSTRHYALADSALVTLVIDLEGGLGTYQVASYHSFRLVRGDAARLGAAQAADSTRWFLRRQDDLAEPLGLRAPRPTDPARTHSATATTWGAIKAQYLQ